MTEGRRDREDGGLTLGHGSIRRYRRRSGILFRELRGKNSLVVVLVVCGGLQIFYVLLLCLGTLEWLVLQRLPSQL